MPVIKSFNALDPVWYCLNTAYNYFCQGMAITKISRSNRVTTAYGSNFNKYPFALLVLFFASSDLFHGVHGTQGQALTTKLAVISHEFCQSCPRKFLSLNDVDTYSELKYDPRASLPSSFTFCVSVLVTSSDLHPILFTLLGNNGQPWFSAKFQQDGDFVGRRCYYSVHNQFAKIDTMWMFPNKGRVPKKC